MPPDLEAQNGADHVHDHVDEEERDGSRLARLRAAERPAQAVVEHGVVAEPAAGWCP